MAHTSLPTVHQLTEIVLSTLRARGGTATIADMLDATVRHYALTAEQLALVHNERRGRRSELSYRLAWARTYLKGKGMIAQTGRGNWTLMEKVLGQ
jgi:restriction system protein